MKTVIITLTLNEDCDLDSTECNSSTVQFLLRDALYEYVSRRGGGTHIGYPDTVESYVAKRYPGPGYSKTFITDKIKSVRTRCKLASVFLRQVLDWKVESR